MILIKNCKLANIDCSSYQSSFNLVNDCVKNGPKRWSTSTLSLLRDILLAIPIFKQNHSKITKALDLFLGDKNEIEIKLENNTKFFIPETDPRNKKVIFKPVISRLKRPRLDLKTFIDTVKT